MDYLAYFAAGLWLTNGIPHFVNGVSGVKFQSPFASPPGVGEFSIGISLDSFTFGIGAILMSLILSWYFGRVRAST